MLRPICYNIPEGKSEQEALSDELLEALEGVFQGVTHAFGDNAVLYRLDIGRVYESVQSGDLVVAGQFVDRSDGEVFDFEINQGTGKVGYKSTGDFLDQQSLSGFLGEIAGEDDNGSESSDSGLYPFDLLLQAINEESSEAYQSPFASKLRKDLDYLGALSALMYHAGATIEAQPLYTGLHSYAIKYALRGLRLFSQSIGSIQSEEAGKAAEAWVDEHGLDFASAVVKEFSARRCVRFQESIQAEDQDGIQELKTLVEEAIGMAMATTTDLIKSVVEADDYRAGDVQATLAAAIEEYCPIDNSEGYNAVENARQLSAEWQEVVTRSGCTEDLSMQALGLPSAQTIPSEQGGVKAPQIEATAEEDSEDDQNREGERIFYVNVGEGPSRNWDDCRQFGFLAAGGGRKWSKQLEKIKTGDTVIAYLKGYGYVGIGKVTATATPATKFMVNGVPIKELPLINDTIRSIKRFSKENGEYLIGVDWEVTVERDKAAWRANAGLFTTALVCASLRNQPSTVLFASNHFRVPPIQMPTKQADPGSHGDDSWNLFQASLLAFLNSYTAETSDSQVVVAANQLLKLCPRGLNRQDIEMAKKIMEIMPSDLQEKLASATSRLITVHNRQPEDSPVSASNSSFFFVGICQNLSDYDKRYDLLEDYVENGDYWSLDDLVGNKIASNAYEADNFWSLLVWEDLSDWARAWLLNRNEVGITPDDRSEFLLTYIGDSCRLGNESLEAICKGISDGSGGYSDHSIHVLKSFLGCDFEPAAEENNYGVEELQEYFDSLSEYSISSCRKILGID